MTKWEAFALAIIGAMVLAIVYAPTPAQEIRLIGGCNGKFYGGMEEDQFPAGCAWIEPVRFDTE